MSERRTIRAYAATKPGPTVEPFEYVSRPLSPNDVEIAISHCGICGADLHAIEKPSGQANYPVVPGHEIIGHVTARGDNVTHLAVGDRVGVGAMVFACLDKAKCTECATDRDSYCSNMMFTWDSTYPDGEKAYGGYAEYIRVLSQYAFKIPAELPSDAAAPLLCAGVTVFSPLKRYATAGGRVGVIGIGGLGHLAIQFGRALDATVVAFSHSANKEEQVRALGASEFVLMSDPDAVAKAARSVDVLLVTVDADGQPWDTYLSFVASGGALVMLGIPSERVSFSAFSLIPRGISMVGSLIGGIKETQDMLELAAKRNVRAVIQKMPMSEANAGLQLMREGKARYRVVLEN